MNAPTRRRHLLAQAPRSLALEARLMFDAAAVADAVQQLTTPTEAPAATPVDTDHAVSEATSALDVGIAASAAPQEVANATTQVVFVLDDVQDHQRLVDGVAPGAQVYVLDASRDGLAQMADLLQGRSGIDAIHVLSHGSAGQLDLGTNHLNQGNLAQHSALLSQIGSSLSAEGDLLLYGCQVADGETGLAFVQKLAHATEADIAASTDSTGATARGGDWVLEHQTSVTAQPLAISDFSGLLANETLSVANAPVLGQGYGPDYGSELTSGEAGSSAGHIELYFVDSATGAKGGYVSVQDLSMFSGGNGKGIYNAATDGTYGAFDQFKDSNGDNRIDADSHDTEYMVIRRTDGAAFSLKELQVTFLDDLTLKVEGFSGGSSTGYVTHTVSNVYSSGVVQDVPLNNLFTSSTKFDNVNEVRVTGYGYINSWATDLQDGSNELLGTSMNLATRSVTIGDPVVADSTAPTVTSVSSSTANGSYKVGDVVSVQVAFSESVTVTGTPQLTLETGTTDRVVNYASGSGTSTLTFTYTVQPGDSSADLDYVGTSALTLNGGSIRDAAGNNATLTLAPPGAANSLGATEALVIDGLVPSVSSSAVSGAPAANATSLTYAISFSEPVSGLDVGDLQLTGTGTAAGSITSVSGSGTSYTVTVDSVSGTGTLRLDVKSSGTGITDAAGNPIASGYTAGASFTLDHTPPVFSSATTTVTGDKVILTYDSALSATTAAGTAFTVTRAGSAVSVSNVSISGSTVELTLAAAVRAGQAVTVAYSDPTGSDDAASIQDTAGNDAASLTSTSVTNNARANINFDLAYRLYDDGANTGSGGSYSPRDIAINDGSTPLQTGTPITGSIYFVASSNSSSNTGTFQLSAQGNAIEGTLYLPNGTQLSGVIDFQDKNAGGAGDGGSGDAEMFIFTASGGVNYALITDGNTVGYTANDAYSPVEVNINVSADKNSLLANLNSYLTEQIAAANVAPTIDLDASGAGNNWSTSFTEGGSAVTVVDTDVLVSDADSATLSSATVVLTNAKTGDQLTVGTLPAGMSSVVNTAVSGQITVTLTGNASAADYQTALKAITFSNSSATPDTTTRSVTVKVNDGSSDSNVATTSITVTSVNSAPALSNLNGDSVTFTEGGSAALLDASGNATVTDADSADFSGGTLTASIVTNRVSGEDVLSLVNQGTGAGQIGLSGSNVTYGGTVIGTLAGGTGTNDLVITFNANATPAAVQALVRDLTYANSNGTDPTTSNRTVRVTVSDGDGGTSSQADITVQVTPVNDAPTLAATGTTVTYTEGSAPVDLFSGVSVSTVESGQNILALTLTVSGVVNGGYEQLSVDGSTVYLTHGTTVTTANGLNVSVSTSGNLATVTISKSGGFSASDAQTVVDGLTYQNTAEDPSAGAGSITLTSIQDSGGTSNGGVDTTTLSVVTLLTIEAVNDTPAITAPPSLNVTEDVTSAITGISFSDVDAGSSSVTATFSVPSGSLAATSGGGVTVSGSGTGTLTLSGSVSNLNTFISGSNLTFTTASHATSNVTLTVGINDGGNTGTDPGLTGTSSNEIASTTVTLQVGAVNDAPVNTVPSAQSVPMDTGLTFSSANGNLISIADLDAGSSAVEVTLTATQGTLSLSGTSGLSFSSGDGSGDATMTFQGSVADINTALAGLVFNPTSGYTGAAGISISTDDLGNTGSGGALNDVDSVTINVTFADSTAPVVTASQVFNYPENQSSGATLGTVAASDAVGVTAFRFSATGTATSADGFFSIDNSGVISLTSAGAATATASNDFETSPNSFTLGVEASDAAGNWSSATDVTLNVSDVDDTAPAITGPSGGAGAASSAKSVPEGTTSVAQLTANESVTWSISGGADAGKFSIDSSGNLSFDSAPDFETPTDAGDTALNNTYVVQVQAVDGSGNVSTQTVTVTVTDVDDTAPAITAGQVFNYSENQSSGATLGTVAASDAVGVTAFRFSATGSSTSADGFFSIDNSGVISLTAAGAAAATASNDFETSPNSFTLGVEASDAAGNWSSATDVTLNVSDVDDTAPAITGPSGGAGAASSAKSVPEGTTAVAQLTANESVTWSISGGADAGKFSIDSSGNLSFDSAPDFEAPSDTDSNNTYVVQVQAVDGSGNVSTQTVTVTVTDVDDTAPQATPDSETIDEDTPITIDVLANDAAGGSGSLTLVSASVDPSQGTVAIVNNQIVFTPATNFNGVASITYVANNGTQDSEPTLALVTVTPVNDLPTAGGDPSNADWDASAGQYVVSTPEDTPRFGSIDTGDVDGNSLNFSTAQPAHGSVEIDPLTGEWTYTPDANFHGSDEFVVTVSDGNGGSTTVTVAVEVTPVNDLPTAGGDPSNTDWDASAGQYVVSTPEDTPRSGSIDTGDVDGNSLNFSAASPAHGSVEIDPATGDWTYTPDANFHGNDSFVVTVSDGNGGSTTVTVAVEVTPVNDLPTFGDPSNPDWDAAAGRYFVTTPEDTERSGSIDTRDIEAITQTFASAMVVRGSMLIDPDGIEWVTDISDTSDAETPVIEEDGEILLTITNEADGPITTAIVEVSGLTFAASRPSHGTVVIDPTTGDWTYTPDANYNGDDAFVVTVTDGDGGSATVNVAVEVTPVNDLPTAGSPSNPDWDAASGRYVVTTLEDTTRTGRIDTGDVDDSTLSFSAAPPAHGTVEIDPVTGAWSYTPDAHYNGMDAFVVTVSDGHGGSTAVTVAVEVTPVNDAPDFGALEPTATQFTTSQDSPWSGQLPAATDREGAALTYDLAEGPAHGTVVVDADGHYRYVPAEGFHGSDSFLARVSDGAGGTATVRIDVEVQPAPTMRLPAESDLGVSDSDRVTSADEITLAGQAQPNQTLHMYAPDGRLLATVVADGDGVWRVDGIPMASLRGDAAGAAAGAPGVYTFTLRPVLADGSDGAALTLGVVRELPPAPIAEPPAPPAEPPAAPAPAPAVAAPALPELPAPAFDSALRPQVQPPADAPPPPPPPAPAPQAPNGNDGDIYTRSSGFRIMVTPSNEPSLKLYRGLDDQVVPAGRTLIVQVPADAFIHTQINETITLTARLANGQPLPSWLMFDGKTGKFVGQPPAGQLQDLAIQVTARDSQGRRVDTMFRIKTSEGTIAPSRSPLSLQLMRREALALDRAGQPGRGDNSAAGWKAVNRAAAARG